MLFCIGIAKTKLRERYFFEDAHFVLISDLLNCDGQRLGQVFQDSEIVAAD